MSTFLPVSIATRKVLLGALLGTVLIAAIVMFFPQGQPPVFNGIPIPFIGGETSLRGKVTYYGERNGISVYELKFINSEVSETMQVDRVYLARIPTSSTIASTSLDQVITTLANVRNVDYYGYRYMDATASVERTNISDPVFKNRFPGKFFASQAARNNDPAHNNGLTNFEQRNQVTLLKTDASAGAVTFEPGSLYVFIINETGGARLAVRTPGSCGNSILEAVEECDDGANNGVNGTCSLDCTSNDIPIPFGSGSTMTGARLSIAVQGLPAAATAVAGQPSITLLRFLATAESGSVLIGGLYFKAASGSFVNTENYKLWYDSNQDAAVDAMVQIVATLTNDVLTFDTVGDANTQLAFAQSKMFEVRADVKGAVTSGSLQLQFNVTDSDYVLAQRMIGVTPAELLQGIATNGTCSVAVCSIGVSSVPSTVWTINAPATAVCGNGTFEPDGVDNTPGTADDEQCDDDNAIGNDGCTACHIDAGYTCNTAVDPSVCTENNLPLSEYALTITTQALPATAEATPDQQDIALYRFEASSNTGILLTTFQFIAEVGTFDNAVNYGLYRIDGATATKVLDGTVMIGTTPYVKFFDSALANDRVITPEAPVMYEVRADAASVPAAPPTLQLAFKVNSVNHATGRRLFSNRTLGIDYRINGDCLLSCQIDEIDIPSTLWTFLTQ